MMMCWIEFGKYEITLNDINKKWLKTDMSGGVEMARSTFNRHFNTEALHK